MYVYVFIGSFKMLFPCILMLFYALKFLFCLTFYKYELRNISVTLNDKYILHIVTYCCL